MSDRLMYDCDTHTLLGGALLLLAATPLPLPAFKEVP